MALAGTNLEHARSYNRRVVVETVRLHGPLSRAEIARATGLSAQTVSNIAEELLESGLLAAAGRRTGGRGQPPVELALNPGGASPSGCRWTIAGWWRCWSTRPAGAGPRSRWRPPHRPRPRLCR